jgi:hypothetical protein
VNKKQLVFIWIAGMLVCASIVFAPRYYITCSKERCITWERPIPGGFTKIKWESVIQRSLVILVISALLVYTLKGKRQAP